MANIDPVFDPAALARVQKLIQDREALEAATAKKLFNMQMSNAQALYEAQIGYLEQRKIKEQETQNAISQKMVKLGYDAEMTLSVMRLKQLEKEQEEAKKGKTAAEIAAKKAAPFAVNKKKNPFE